MTIRFQGFGGVVAIALAALICAALSSCSALAPADEPGADSSDLMVAAPSVSDVGPAAGAAFTLSATVRNAGDGASDSTTLRYYRSPDAEITHSDAEVGTDAVAELAASGTSSQSVSLTAPTTAGTYYYGACVDAVEGESDTANNCSSSVPITVPQPMPGPNLVVSSSSVSNSAPAAGTTFTLSATVRNDGDEASAVTTMRFYRSTDTTITTADTEVGTAGVTEIDAAASSSQAASSTYYYHDEVEVNAPSTAGTYYYGACVDAVADESETTNNCSSSVGVTVRSSEQQVQGTPDLNPYTIVVEAGLASLSPGGSFSLSVGVRNDGNGSSAATTLRYYRSTDATVTTSDTEVDTDDLPSLAPSATSTQSVSLTAPTTPGTYYYGACVDAVTDESDTTNNCSESVQVTVPEPKPDLVVRGYAVSDPLPAPDTTFKLWATVWNLGDGSSAATTVRWYHSTDTTVTTSDTQVGTGAVAELAASGSSALKSVELTAPTSPGTYYYGTCVDAVAGESDTTNNCASTQITVRAPHLVRIYSASGAVTEGMSVRFRVTSTPPPTADLEVTVRYNEHTITEDEIILSYQPVETTLTIRAASSSTTLTVDSIDDSDDDGNSWLQASVRSGSGYTAVYPQIAVVAVVDDDGPTGDSLLSITPVSMSVSEGTAVAFTVHANPAPTVSVTVGYRVYETGSTFSDPLDAGGNPGTVTIGAGQSTATLSFDTDNDSTDEEDSEVEVTLRVDTYPDGVTLGQPAIAYVTVLDDD